ncbi:hypothetical protein Tco_0260389 [Tanacetum coccineum]
MLSFEVKLDFKKWETILRENSMSLLGNKDHPNVCMAYMLYCLTIQKPFNLAYYIAERMESVTRSDMMVLPYGMLLTRLYRHVHTTHPYVISDIHHLVDHVMIPLTKGKACRKWLMGKGLTLKPFRNYLRNPLLLKMKKKMIRLASSLPSGRPVPFYKGTKWDWLHMTDIL